MEAEWAHLTNGRLYFITSVLDGNYLQPGDAIPGYASRLWLTLAPGTGHKDEKWRADADWANFKITTCNGSGLALTNHIFTHGCIYLYEKNNWSQWTTVHLGNGEVQIRTLDGNQSYLLRNAGIGKPVELVTLDKADESTNWTLIAGDLEVARNI